MNHANIKLSLLNLGVFVGGNQLLPCLRAILGSDVCPPGPLKATLKGTFEFLQSKLLLHAGSSREEEATASLSGDCPVKENPPVLNHDAKFG